MCHNLAMFIRWKNNALETLEMCFSKHKLLSSMTPRSLPVEDDITAHHSTKILYRPIIFMSAGFSEYRWCVRIYVFCGLEQESKGCFFQLNIFLFIYLFVWCPFFSHKTMHDCLTFPFSPCW